MSPRLVTRLHPTAHAQASGLGYPVTLHMKFYNQLDFEAPQNGVLGERARVEQGMAVTLRST